MKRLDRDLRRIDPLAATSSEPDGERLLERILHGSAASPARRSPLRLYAPVALATGVTVAAVGALFAVMPLGTSDEREVAVSAAGAKVRADGSVLNYAMRERTQGLPVQAVEVWQADDGSRERVLRRPGGDGSFAYHELVITPGRSQSFIAPDDPPQIVEYHSAVYGKPSAPAGYSLPRAVGDPRTLPERADRGEPGVEALRPTSVRGEPALRFRVGTCDGAARTATVWLALESHVPLRARTRLCRKERLLRLVTTIDYIRFEILDRSPENLSLLRMSDHPGVPVVSGEAIDRREEEMETPPAPTPTPPAGG